MTGDEQEEERGGFLQANPSSPVLLSFQHVSSNPPWALHDGALAPSFSDSSHLPEAFLILPGLHRVWPLGSAPDSISAYGDLLVLLGLSMFDT